MSLVARRERLVLALKRKRELNLGSIYQASVVSVLFSLLPYFNLAFRQLYFGINFHYCIVTDTPTAIITTIKALQHSRSKIYAKFAKQ